MLPPLNRGFTLVEMLLSIVIIAIIAGLATPLYFSYLTNNDFGLTIDTGVRSLRRANFLAQNQDRDSNWGTYFSTSSITVYVGSSYAVRNTNYDELYQFPTTISSTNAVDVNFTKFTGEPSTTTAINIRSNNGNSSTIYVNSKGMIDYQ